MLFDSVVSIAASAQSLGPVLEHGLGTALPTTELVAGIFDTGSRELSSGVDFMVKVGLAIASFFIVKGAWSSKGALGGIAAAALSAGVIGFLITNPNFVKDMLQDEVTSSGPSSSVVRVVDDLARQALVLELPQASIGDHSGPGIS